MTDPTYAREMLHPADPMLSVLELAFEAEQMLKRVETLIVIVANAKTADDRYRAATALSAHMRSIQSKTKVAWDKADRINNLALLACKKEAAARGAPAGTYQEVSNG